MRAELYTPQRAAAAPGLALFIVQLEQLATFAAASAGHESIALDTEFLRERTYRAELCLIQVSIGGQAACIDPLAINDLSSLAALLTTRKALKVMHAARQDLEVLLPAVGHVAPVFDTQVAAGLAGFAPQIGYAELTKRLLGIELAKAHTRADWSRRPLSAEQIEYALDDVRHLLPLRDSLTETLERQGRLTWLDEELSDLARPECLAVDPQSAWKRVKGLGGLDAGRMTLAQRLAAWREQRAIDRNRPRGWILDDAVLRDIVLRVPDSPQALAAIPEIPEGVLRNSAAELLAIVESVGLPKPPPPLPRRERPDAAMVALVRRLAAVTADVAQEHGLSAELLATRRELEQVAAGKQDAPPLVGWRREVIGNRLTAQL